MNKESLCCPSCNSENIIKHGKTSTGKQRYLCQNPRCYCSTFILDYSYNGSNAHVKRHIIDLAQKGRKVREIKRMLNVSEWVVIDTIRRFESPYANNF